MSPEERAAEEAPEQAGEASVDEQAQEVTEDLERLTEVERERDEYLELAQRARADFENYRKRAATEAADAERRAKASLAKELLPALDNLERAMRAAGVDPEATGETEAPPSEEVSAQQALAQGVALVYRELREALARAGVEAYDPEGEEFDPEWHEAIATQPADGRKPGTVLETVDRGYRLDGQVLRAARVIVGE